MTADVASVQTLIDNVRASMKSDTATLLLLDETGAVLEPAASAGLGRRWRGATHVPVGSGFAGRVAAGREPVVVNEVNEVSVLNPILRDFGLRRLLGVPVFGSDGLLGRPARGEPDDTNLHTRGHGAPGGRSGEDRPAPLRADRGRCALGGAGLAAQPASGRASGHRRSRRRGALPARRRRPGRRLVRHLHAAQRQGRCRDGRCRGTWPPLGRRHGPAAQRTACLRPRLRRPGRSAAPPRSQALLLRERALGHRHVRRHRSSLRPRDDLQRGPPGTLGRPARATVRGDRRHSRHGLLLGLDPEQPRHSEEVALAPGAALAFYTDGLVERRRGSAQHTDPDVERLELVRRAFVASDNAETACSRIIAEGLGDDSVEDDVALVVMRRPT